jgi:hypothetical protein
VTRPTALALIRRLDQNRELHAAGREITMADIAETAALLARSRNEDRTVRRGLRGRAT